MTKQLITLIALSIGAFMVLSTLSFAARFIPALLEAGYPLSILAPLAPVILSTFLAFLIYRFATRIQIDESANTSDALLFAGTKFFGFYLFIEGIAIIIGSVSFMLRDDINATTGVLEMILGLVYLLFSFFLVKKTTLLIQLLSKGD